MDERVNGSHALNYTLGHGCRNPILCVLPPHILEALATNGNLKQRQRALRNLSLSNSFFAARVGLDESKRPERQAQRLQMGQALALQMAVGGQKQRSIYTANNQNRIPGTLVRSEGDPPTNDPATDEAYEYMGNTYDFYWNVFSRNSIDNRGMTMDGTVHYEKDYDNAFWDGQRMIYGDGDQEQFTRFTKSVDVIGHELTHGVTQYEAGLIYWKQTGALNESISDIFGSLVKQYVQNQTAAQADWLIGEDLFTDQWMSQNPQDVAIRSLKAPGTAYNDPVLGKDPQPAHMSKYVDTLQDNGGVHINSGIPNHAFYLAAVALGGYAWQTVGPIWYAALQSPDMSRTTQFQHFASLTGQIADQLYPGGPEYQVLRNAWAQVGINI